MKTSIILAAAAALLSACGGDSNGPPAPAGMIDQLEIVSTADAYNGATPAGAAGPYSVITGIVHGKLNPNHPDNAGIVDLTNAPVGADGYVSYTTDVVILRPKAAANARRVLFYDVVNRGSKIGQSTFVGGGVLTTGAAPDATFPSMLRAGYTVVWSGWQGGIAQTGTGATAAVGVAFPVATNKDGTSITGLSREEFIPDYAGGTATVIPLTYPPASLTDKSEVTFTARQSWLNATGKEDYATPSVPVATWSYVTNANGSVSVQFTPPAAVPTPSGATVPADAGTIYSFVYRAKDPIVMGVGFAAVRDLVAFLRNSTADAKGTANPLNDMKQAACASGTACPASPTTNFDVALGEGISQSGRFMRDFLYQGFNKDANGNAVFDGMMPIIPAGRRTWVNTRFAQGGRWSKQHEDHWMPGDQFPFTYGVMTDPVSGTTDGLLKSCLSSNTCPKIMQIDGSFEWWGGRASLVVTDGAGHDIALPANVRYYLVSGTQHFGGAGVTTGVVTEPAAGSMCQFAASPVSEQPVLRALVPALDNWVSKNTAPPASQYPTVASGQLVASDQASVGFPNLSNVTVPSGAAATPTPVSLTYSGNVNQLFVTDYSNAVPVPNLGKQYTLLVPKVDANGNETSGIRVPELTVPVATYMGWNLRGTGHAVGDGCSSTGSAIPFAANPATKAATDPRTTVASLYTGRGDYQTKFAAATDALVAQGFLTALDGTNVYKAGSANISAALIPAP
ncbi:MAG TPA: alpha/beta hydrolase domain-containing protein [Caldimonas sp.]|nr:alpha/beta hydrolase domain-containing protein [Caldimonas sp.]